MGFSQMEVTRGHDTGGAAAAAPAGGRERSLSWHLALLSLTLVLPVIALGGFFVWSFVEHERARLEGDALRIAREVTAVVDRDLAGIVVTAKVLAVSPRLGAGDLEGFDKYAREVSKMLGLSIVLHNHQSQQLVNTRLPPGVPLPASDYSAYNLRMLQRKQAVASGVLIGTTTRRPFFAIGLPVMRGEEVVYFLSLVLEPGRIHDLLLKTVSPANWQAIVVDRNGRVVADSTGSFAPGQELPTPIKDELKGRDGIVQGTGLGNDHGWAITGFSSSQDSGWTALVTVPGVQVVAPIRQSLAVLAGAGGAMVALSGWLALVFSRRISRAVGAVAVQAAANGHGRPAHRVSTPVSEVNTLSRALAEASRERQAAEAALRTSEERFRLAQAAARIGTWDWDAKSGVMTCSATYCELYGLDPAGPGHESVEAWLAQVHPNDREHAKRDWRDALKMGRRQSAFRIIHADGSLRWIVSRGAAIRDADGQITRLVGVTVDMTEAHAASERVRELQFELSQAARLSAVGEMAGSFAHELNQPLGAATSFIGAAQLALKTNGPDASAEVVARLARAAEQVVRAGAIVRRIRDFIGHGETEKQIVDLQELLEEAMALALIGVRDPHLRIRYDVEAPAPSILVDRIQLQQVIFNLVKNALEAMADREPREIVLASRSIGDGKVEISVADTGPGLPENPEELFKPFVTSKAHGMGIGLSICRTIVEVHHGRLWAEPRAGGGAVFRLAIPVAPSE